MTLEFLTPLGALLAVAVLLPLAAYARMSARAARMRKALHVMEPPPRRRRLPPLLAALAIAGLLGLAAAQPVLGRTTAHRLRTDAEAYVVIDVSRSMLASRGPGASSRLQRAKVAAARLRASLPDVRVGIASMTDRVLPHLLPSADEDVFRTTLERAIQIESPPPRASLLTTATSLDSLAAIATQRFYSPSAKHRLLVVLTDGESQPVSPAAVKRNFRGARIETVFLQVWDGRERVYTRGAPEPQYRPNPSAREILERLAADIGGSVYGEGDLRAATRKARHLLGNGPTRVEGERRTRVALARYLSLAAFLPLALLLWRRER